MSTESIMIASHQIRMKKFIKDLAKRANKSYNKKKINNCSIIKIELRNELSNIEMVYWGGNEGLTNIDTCNPPPKPDPNEKFYSNDENNLNFDFNTDLLIKNLSKDLDVYIIRHGEGTHNEFKDKYGKLLNYTRQIPLIGSIFGIDNPLNASGEKQAFNAGKIMDKCINNSKYTSLNNIKEVYSSDLKRTQQTLIKFFSGFNNDGVKYNLENITVIPGAHEIGKDKYISIIYSDDGFPGLLPIAYENTTSYTTNQENTTYVDGIEILWTKYRDFYGGYTRNHITCNDSIKFEDNFVSNAVKDYLGVFKLPDTPDENPDEVKLPDAPVKLPDAREPLDSSVEAGLSAPDESVEVRSVGGGKKSKFKTHKKPKKVKVTYKNKTKIIPEKYIAGLKGKERKAQIKSIFENTDRPKTSFKEKRSEWIIKFEKKYNQKITDKSWIHKNIITNTGQNKILSKGRGAYYSSGSRPNQTPDSWAYARLASVIMNGPSRKYDMKIWNKYKV